MKNENVDTTLSVQRTDTIQTPSLQSLANFSYRDTDLESNTGSTVSDRGSEKTKTSTNATTKTNVQCSFLIQKHESNDASRLPYTVVDGEAREDGWDLANGFPFPCPVVRDPARRGAIYIPGEVLRFNLRHPSRLTMQKFTSQPERIMSLPPVCKMEMPCSEFKRSESCISLSEAFRRMPIQLSSIRDGNYDSDFDHAWPWGDPEISLRERFALMDPSQRSKFIGLKNSSARVRDKLREKRVTNYKEVAEELVDEIGLTDARDAKSVSDAENLKRRVYDVLNVFEAVGLIEKDNKSVVWKGSSEPRDTEVNNLESRLEFLKTNLEKKRRYLEQLQESYRALIALTDRNRSIEDISDEEKIFLPFVLIHAPEDVPVDVKIGRQSKKVQLDFTGKPFFVHGDMWALRQLGLHSIPSSPVLKTSDSGSDYTPAQSPQGYLPGLLPDLNDDVEAIPERIQPFVPMNAATGVEAIRLSKRGTPEEPEVSRKRRRADMDGPDVPVEMYS